MFVVRRGGEGGRWIEARRCPDAESAETVYHRWSQRFSDQEIELCDGAAVLRSRFPIQSSRAPLPSDPVVTDASTRSSSSIARK